MQKGIKEKLADAVKRGFKHGVFMVSDKLDDYGVTGVGVRCIPADTAFYAFGELGDEEGMTAEKLIETEGWNDIAGDVAGWFMDDMSAENESGSGDGYTDSECWMYMLYLKDAGCCGEKLLNEIEDYFAT